MELKRAQEIAEEIMHRLAPFCQEIEVAGSVRRRRPYPNDIDIVLVPRDPWGLEAEIRRLGQMVMGGPKLKRLTYNGVQVDIYIASADRWGILLLVRTGSERHNIMLATQAQQMGLKFSAADGIVKDGKVVASATEEEVFGALGMPWMPPEEREH